MAGMTFLISLNFVLHFYLTFLFPRKKKNKTEKVRYGMVWYGMIWYGIHLKERLIRTGIKFTQSESIVFTVSTAKFI